MKKTDKKKEINTSHAWKGVWARPMSIDEDSLQPADRGTHDRSQCERHRYA